MSTMPQKLLTIAALAASCAGLNGCAVSSLSAEFTSRAAVTGEAGVAASPSVIGSASATLMPCSGPTCVWTAPDGTQFTSTVHLTCSDCQEADLVANAVDVVIFQIRDSATGITGTYDNGHGSNGPLQVVSGLASLPIDAQSSLVAESGMQLIIVQLPAGARREAYTFTFQMSAFPPNVKALLAGKVQVGGTTYHPLFLPCVTDMASVPTFEFTAHVPAPLLTPSFLAQIHGCSGKVYTFPSGGPPTLDLNQHGLTGSWYEKATDGQGVEVEVFPDHQAPGTGDAFVSWFTYDTVIGGADHQRWYTAQGQVVTGQPNASLTIYQNTGGNFDAPPVTSAQPVGTATLSFDTCSSGKLMYSFTDGTNRTRTIPLTRLTQNVTCSTTSPHPTNPDFALSGNWFALAKSGQGITAEVNPISGAFFAAWYTYAPMGAGAGAAGQRWYTAQGTFTPGMRSIPVTIYENRWDVRRTDASWPENRASGDREDDIPGLLGRDVQL